MRTPWYSHIAFCKTSANENENTVVKEKYSISWQQKIKWCVSHLHKYFYYISHRSTIKHYCKQSVMGWGKRETVRWKLQPTYIKVNLKKKIHFRGVDQIKTFTRYSIPTLTLAWRSSPSWVVAREIGAGNADNTQWILYSIRSEVGIRIRPKVPEEFGGQTEMLFNFQYSCLRY